MKTLLLTSALFAVVLRAFAEDAVPAPSVSSGTLTISGSGTLAPGTPDASGQVTVSSGTLTFNGTAVPAAQAAPVAKASPATGYELRGFFGVGEKAEASIRVPGSVESRWYAVGKKSGSVLVEKVDTKAGTAVILAAGRRISLRLAGEAAPSVVAAPVVVEEAKPAAPDIKSREYRQKRFQEMMEKASEAQKTEFGRVMRERFEKLRKENPDFDFHNPKNAEAAFETSLGVMREAAESAHKLPDKEGKITPVASDFEPLMREEFKANEEMRKARRAEREKAASTPAPDASAVKPPETAVVQ